MKWTKLSLVAALAVSASYAGGDVAPVVAAASAPSTTIDGKLVGYYYTDNSDSLFDKNSTSGVAAITLNVSHKFTENITGNVSAVGYAQVSSAYDAGYNPFSLINTSGDDSESGAWLNVANLTAVYGDTTLVVGRQLISSPMVQGYDWLLAPGAFEAFTAVNTSIDKVTLVGTYLTKYRANWDTTFVSGENFIDLEGENYAFGAMYSDSFDVSAWFYNVDALDYKQYYFDVSKEFSGVTLSAQYVDTDNGSTAFGFKAATKLGAFDVEGAYVKVSDATTPYVDYDGLYTSMWMTVTGDQVGSAYKLAASTEIGGLSTSVAYAKYDTDVAADESDELNVILGYGLTDDISLDGIYSEYDASNIKTVELIATYKF
jgi:hypothetical protein